MDKSTKQRNIYMVQGTKFCGAKEPQKLYSLGFPDLDGSTAWTAQGKWLRPAHGREWQTEKVVEICVEHFLLKQMNWGENVIWDKSEELQCPGFQESIQQ